MITYHQIQPASHSASPARIQDLLFNSRRVATGLHWGEPADWLREHPAWSRTIWRRGQLVGLLACTPPLHGASWLRLCALHDDVEALPTFCALWRQLRAALLGHAVREVCLIAGRQGWLRDCLPASGFSYSEAVVTLHRSLKHAPAPVTQDASIRLALDSDLDRLLALDAAAFPAHWRMSAAEMRQALRRAASFTVLVEGNKIHGFQITQGGGAEAHLARLAVAPGRQGQGLGALLLGNLIGRLRRRAIVDLTVNTQQHNRRSLGLYRRFGFRRNGRDYSVWSQQLAPAVSVP